MHVQCTMLTASRRSTVTVLDARCSSATLQRRAASAGPCTFVNRSQVRSRRGGMRGDRTGNCAILDSDETGTSQRPNSVRAQAFHVRRPSPRRPTLRSSGLGPMSRTWPCSGSRQQCLRRRAAIRRTRSSSLRTSNLQVSGFRPKTAQAASRRTHAHAPRRPVSSRRFRLRF